MPETTSSEARAQTSPRLPMRARPAEAAGAQIQEAFVRIAGFLKESLIVRFTTVSGDNSSPHVLDPAGQAQLLFDNLRRRHPVERTEQYLDQLMNVAKPAAIVARLIDERESDVLKARLVTAVPRLRGLYREEDLLAVLGLLATSTDSEIRYVVADALAEFGGDEAKRVLQILAEDSIPAIRTVAQEHLSDLE